MRPALVLLALLAACARPAEPANDVATEDAPVPLERRAVDPATTGAIAGRVRFDGAPPPRKEMAIAGRAGCENHPVPPLVEDLIVEDGGLANVFVAVKRGHEGWIPPAAPDAPALLDQVGCLFRPRVVGLRPGQSLRVRNSDPTSHNVHVTARRNPEINPTQAPGSPDVTWRAERVETGVAVGCDLHPWMKAWVHVRDHPWFAVADARGAFRIEGLPPGAYLLEAWHEKLGTRTAEVVVPAGGEAGVEIVFRAP